MHDRIAQDVAMATQNPRRRRLPPFIFVRAAMAPERSANNRSDDPDLVAASQFSILFSSLALTLHARDGKQVIPIADYARARVLL